jgi:Fic family protein
LDEKKAAEEATVSSIIDLKKLQKTHDEDLKLIENLRKNYDKSSKAAEDLRANNADLAKTLSNKEQKIQDLKKALADQKETSERDIFEMLDRLRLLFEEYEKIPEELWCSPCSPSCQFRDFRLHGVDRHRV